MSTNFSNIRGHENISQFEFYLDFTFSIASCIVLLFTLCVGIAANLFVIWAVYHQKSLQTSNNALLVNLAVTDLLRCSIDCPLLLAVVLRFPKYGDFGTPLCYAQIVCFSFSCCVQLITLASISAERYQAIAYPFKTSQRRKRIKVWIPLTWTISIPLSVLSATFVGDNPVYIKCRGVPTDHLSSYNSFGLYIVVPLWLGCLIVITGFYGRIFLLVRTHSRKIFDKGVSPPPKKNKKVVQESNYSNDTNPVIKCSKTQDERLHGTDTVPQSAEATSDDPLKTCVPDNDKIDSKGTPEFSITKDVTQSESLCVSCEPKESTSGDTGLNPFLFAEEPIVNDLVETAAVKNCADNLKNEIVDVTNLPTKETAPDVEEPILNDLMEMDTTIVPETEPADNVNNETVEITNVPMKRTAPDESIVASPAAPDQSEEVAGAVCMMPSFADRERVNKNKESKLAKRSGYIILTFLLFWIPLILSVLVNFFVESYKSTEMPAVVAVDIFSISVACITSASNPVTYAVVNPQFRSEFKRLRAKCKAAVCHKY